MRVHVALVALLFVLPTVAALDVATRSAKVRPSAEYSPETAWDLGYYGCGVTVAVFDEGVDDEHPWLKGRVVAGVDTSDTSVFWTQANGGNPQPLQGSHGTPVAGIVASHAGLPMTGPDAVPEWKEEDRVGVAPCAWLVDVQFNDLPQPMAAGACAGTCFEKRVLDAFAWAIEHKDDDWGDADPSNDGIEVITMSWSPDDETDGSHPICQAATRAVEAGIVVLGSAGNSGTEEKPDLGCPTGADGAISVANVCDGHESTPTTRTVARDDDRVCVHSTWGPRTDDGDGDMYEEMKPDIASPGQGIMSTDDARLDGREYAIAGCGDDSQIADPAPYFGSCETSFGGTSAATPFTAGVVALMLEANGNLTPYDVREILHQIAVPWEDQLQNLTAPDRNAKWNAWQGYGMMDAHAAIRMAVTWPGLMLGQDLDSDGLRDYLDTFPHDPQQTVRKALSDLGVQPVGGDADSDGDGVPDRDDVSPLDPSLWAADDRAGQQAPWGAIAALGLLAAAFLRRR